MGERVITEEQRARVQALVDRVAADPSNDVLRQKVEALVTWDGSGDIEQALVDAEGTE